MLSLHTILHPTDFSLESVAAFRLASALARDYGAKLVLVTVYPPSRSEVEVIDRAQRDRIDEDLLGNLKDLAVDAGAAVEFRVEEGEPADMILAVAEKTHADLIVMGTHGRSGVRRLLMGSVAEAVNRRATCPVLTVRGKLRLTPAHDMPMPGEAGSIADAEAGPEDRRVAPGSTDDPTCEVAIPAGSVTLQGTLWWPRDARGVVVFAHGLEGNRYCPSNWVTAAHLTGAGFAALLVDLLPDLKNVHRGEVPDIALLADRLVAAAQWLTHQPETVGLPIGYFGADTGGAAALLAAASHPGLVSAVVCCDGRPHLAEEDLRSVRAPTLLIVGWDDEPVMSWNQDIQKHLTCPKDMVVLPGTLQTLEYRSLEQVTELTREWFERHLAAKTKKVTTTVG